MKKYSILSFILIGLAGLFTYINTNATTTFSLFGVNITLYNALWTVLFLFVFYLISMIFFAIEKFKNFKFDRNVKKDKNNILKNIENKILYKNKLLPIIELKDLEEFIEMIEGDKIKFKESKNSPFLNDLMKLQNGEVIDLKKYKFDTNNPWYLKNLENGILKEDKEKLKEALNSPLKDKALQVLGKISDVKEILANNYPIFKETILNNLDHPRLNELIEKSNLSNKDYIEIAQALHKNTKNPETLLELFKNKKVVYIYLLIEYEMIDKALEEAKENDVKYFEYYLLLRKEGVKIDIKEYMDATI